MSQTVSSSPFAQQGLVVSLTRLHKTDMVSLRYSLPTDRIKLTDKPSGAQMKPKQFPHTQVSTGRHLPSFVPDAKWGAGAPTAKEASLSCACTYTLLSCCCCSNSQMVT